MKEILILAPLTLIILAIKSTLFAGVPFPDILLIIVFYFAYSRRTMEGTLFAFLMGYIEDSFSGTLMGSTSFTLIITFILVYLFSTRVHFTSPQARFIFGSSLELLKLLLLFVLVRLTGHEAELSFWIIPQALVTGLFTPFTITIIENYIARKSLGESDEAARIGKKDVKRGLKR